MNSNIDVKKVGKTITYLRKKNGLTQLQLAEKLFVSDKAVSRWETGEGLPEIVNMMELANIFNVSLEVLLKGEYSDFAEQSSQTDNQQYNLSSAQNNNAKNINEQIIDSKQTQPKTESKYLVQHIISLCLGGISIIASVIFPFLVNFVLALVGLILSKNPEKVQLGKIAKIVNIIAMVISIIAIAIVAIMILNQNIYPF